MDQPSPPDAAAPPERVLDVDLDAAARGAWLPRFAVQRPVTVVMGFLALLVLGAIAYLQIPLQLLPSGYTPPFLYVQVGTLPSPPKDVEETIAIPVEEAFGSVRNVHRVRSWVRSSSAGFLMEFKEGTDMDVAYNQVRDRLERARPELPEEVSSFFIWKYNPNNDPVFWMGAMLPEDLRSEDIQFTLESKLTRRLERIPGVSRVEIEGAPGTGVIVELDDARANAAGVGTYALVNQLQQDNFALAGGVVSDAGRRYPLRLVARYSDLEQVRAIPVGQSGLTLGDVADVRMVATGERAVYRVNGKRGVIVKIFKDAQANTVEVCRAVREITENPTPSLQAFEFIAFFDQGFYIEESLDNLQQTALWGALFAIIVLLFFLRRWRITGIITLAIPVSLLVTLVVMYFTDSSLNVLSLMGLMLSVGMVVDNSIVVVENIQRVRMSGATAREAAVYGAGEVGLAIVVATSTTVVVFLPLILMSGSQTLSFYLSKIGYPVCISLVASLVVSLIFIPLASSTRVGGGGEAPARSRLIEAVERAYGRVLDLSLRRRVDAVLVALAVLASMAWPMQHVSQSDVEGGNPNDYRLFVNFPDQMTYEEKDAYLKKAEKALWDQQDALGIEDTLTRLGGNWGRGRIRVFLKPPAERPEGDRNGLIKKAQEALPEWPGVSATTRWSERAASDAITVQISGPDSGRLQTIAEDLSWRLRNIPGVLSAEPETDDDSTRELRLAVQREQAQARGLSPLLVGMSIDYATRGRRLNDFHAPDREIPMTVISPEDDRETVEDIERLELRDPLSGGGIQVGAITRTTLAPAYARINRQDRRTVLSINVTTDTEDLGVLGEQIDGVVKGYTFPRGYSASKGDRFQRLQQNAKERTFAISLAVLFVFLLMGVLFESFVLPISIVISIPFAFVGVYWALYLTNTTFDVMAGVGLVILIGVVVNNAVVLIDLVGLLRGQGLTRREAIVEAGRKRLRPIVMTALTTIFGLIPMAAGSASLVGIPYAPLGRALIGGLIASTALTLFVVPLCYTFFDDLSQAIQRVVRGVFGRALPWRKRAVVTPEDAANDA